MRNRTAITIVPARYSTPSRSSRAADGEPGGRTRCQRAEAACAVLTTRRCSGPRSPASARAPLDLGRTGRVSAPQMPSDLSKPRFTNVIADSSNIFFQRVKMHFPFSFQKRVISSCSNFCSVVLNLGGGCALAGEVYVCSHTLLMCDLVVAGCSFFLTFFQTTVVLKPFTLLGKVNLFV